MARGLVKLISTLHGVPFLASSFEIGFLELSTSWNETQQVNYCGVEFFYERMKLYLRFHIISYT